MERGKGEIAVIAEAWSKQTEKIIECNTINTSRIIDQLKDVTAELGEFSKALQDTKLEVQKISTDQHYQYEAMGKGLNNANELARDALSKTEALRQEVDQAKAKIAGFKMGMSILWGVVGLLFTISFSVIKLYVS